MKRPNSSVVWKMPKEELEQLVRSATSISDILRSFGIRAAGGNNKTLKRRLDAENIDYSHIPQGRGSNSGRHRGGFSHPDEDVFCDDSSVSRHNVKRRIIQRNLLPYECAICRQNGTWNGIALVLILDHINGKWNDNRLENLRLVCPNCNSQLETHAGKKGKH